MTEPGTSAEVEATAGELAWLKAGTAVLWLTTALGVLHPYYRQVGRDWLARLLLPDALMWLACAAELALAVAIMVRPPGRALALLQVGGVASFTLVLAALDPLLLVHPFGVLSKNYPFTALVLATWLVAREGFSARALWVLRAGMALVWITEGLFPKVLFQQPMELAVVARSGLAPFEPALFLRVLGLLQVASGVAALLLRGRALRALLAAQIAALVVLPVLVSWPEPLWWFHPFGPLTKNVPILFGHVAALRRCPR